MTHTIHPDILVSANSYKDWAAEDGGLSFNCLLANDFEANADLLAEFDGEKSDTTGIAVEAIKENFITFN